MTSVSQIGVNKITAWQKTKTVLKNVGQRAYLYGPVAGLLTLYAGHCATSGQPMFHITKVCEKIIDPLTNTYQYFYRDTNGNKQEAKNLYGPLLIYGAWFGYELARDAAVAKGIKPAVASAAYISTLTAGVIGAKLLGFAQFHEHSRGFLDFMLHSGGTWYGGVAGGLLTLAIIAKATKTSYFKLLDSLTPAALIGLGIGRMGCWIAGCCDGKLAGMPVEPLMIAADIGMGLALSKTEENNFDGKTVFKGLMLYSAFRFIIEIVRNEPTVALGLTLSQLISSVLFAGSALLYRRLSKNKSKAENLPPQPEIINKPVPSPKQRFFLRIAEILSLSPLFYFIHAGTAVVILIINGIRLIKDGSIITYNWLKNRKNVTS